MFHVVLLKAPPLEGRVDYGVLDYLSRTSMSLYLNMFGYDDDELNDQCMRCAGGPAVTTVITLDKSQSGGQHEKTILNSDMAKDPAAFNTHVVVGQSATHPISHTKGGVLDGCVGFEGSTNWSTSGEGTFVVKGKPGGPNYKAQNSTLAVFTDPDTIARFTAELIAAHLAATGGGLPAPRRSPGRRRRRSEIDPDLDLDHDHDLDLDPDPDLIPLLRFFLHQHLNFREDLCGEAVADGLGAVDLVAGGDGDAQDQA